VTNVGKTAAVVVNSVERSPKKTRKKVVRRTVSSDAEEMCRYSDAQLTARAAVRLPDSRSQPLPALRGNDAAVNALRFR